MGIMFFKKNIYDLTNSAPLTTITDNVATNKGDLFVNLMRNRDDKSGWSTTGSSDAANTTIEIDFIDSVEMDRILLLNHNFKSFTIKYWNGSAWTNFSTTIAPTNNTLNSNLYSFTKVTTQKIQLIILGTQTANQDKFLRQFIFTESIGEMISEPYIKPVFDKDRKQNKFISGRTFVSKSVGGFQCDLKLDSIAESADLALVEKLFDQFEGFLVYLSGGTTSQYENLRLGYRLNDIFYMACTNEYKPEWKDGYYKHGMPVDLRLVEIN